MMKYFQALLICLVVRHSVLCPTQCKCYFTKVSCEDKGLKTEHLQLLAEQLSNRTEILYLGSNLINEFPIKLFQKLVNLRELHLRNNNLSRIPDNSNYLLPKLRELSLPENQIYNIKKENFVGYQKIHALYLQGNQIASIPSQCFIHLKSLKSLYLEENRIKLISPYTFKGLSQLNYLSLGDNRLQNVPRQSFKDMTMIQHLYLNNNEVSIIPNDLYSTLYELSYLDLSENRISKIDSKAFFNMTSAGYIEIILHGNILKYLPSSAFKLSSNLKLYISDNNFYCDCALVKSFNILKRYNDLIGAKCETPFKLNYHNVEALNETDINCKPCDIIGCDNNGTCTEANKKAVCICPKNFRGKFCGVNRNSKSCENNKCKNNGICQSVDNTRYKCQCSEPFYGNFCEVSRSKNNTTATWVAVGICVLAVVVAVTLGAYLYQRNKTNRKFMITENNDELFLM